MPWDLVIFYLLAAACILAAGGVVAASNPVHSAIFLVLCFFNVAGIFVMMGAEFLAAIQVIVYTGAIMVLMVFVLMLVDPDDLPEFHQGRPVQRAVGVLLGLILLLEVSVAILNRHVVGLKGNATAQAIDSVGGNTQALGRVLYSDYLFAFEVVSLVLTERLGLKSPLRRGTISLAHGKGIDVEEAALPAGGIEEMPLQPVSRDVAAKPTGGRRLVM